MIKPEQTVPLDFYKKMVQHLCDRKCHRELAESLASYLQDNLRMFMLIMEGLRMWTREKIDKEYQGEAVILSLMKLMASLRQNVIGNDGIVDSFLSQYQVPSLLGNQEARPWHFVENPDSYRQISGVFQQLRGIGLPGEFIDRYYLDGSLIELYEGCIEVTQPLLRLARMENPSPRDVWEGLNFIEEKTRRMVEKFFVDDYSGVRGIHGCLQEVLVILHEKGQQNAPAPEAHR